MVRRVNVAGVHFKQSTGDGVLSGLNALGMKDAAAVIQRRKKKMVGVFLILVILVRGNQSRLFCS